MVASVKQLTPPVVPVSVQTVKAQWRRVTEYDVEYHLLKVSVCSGCGRVIPFGGRCGLCGKVDRKSVV